MLCVVDLDTVMPGFVLSDFGDFIRTGANKGAEDDKNLDNVSVDLEIFEAYAKGYLQKASSFLTDVEIENLAFGSKLLTYMQTVRFLPITLMEILIIRSLIPSIIWCVPKHSLNCCRAWRKILMRCRIL